MGIWSSSMRKHSTKFCWSAAYSSDLWVSDADRESKSKYNLWLAAVILSMKVSRCGWRRAVNASGRVSMRLARYAPEYCLTVAICS